MDKQITLEDILKQRISPVSLPNKNELYTSILEIDHSMTERLDASLANIFIFEAAQLLANAIYLFETGYFDAAFYSIRQAIEIATTMMYLSDTKDEAKRKEAVFSWKCEQRFPMTKQMLSNLKTYGDVVANMQEVMPEFFTSLDTLCAKINKIVHKQGFDYLFVTRDAPFASQRKDLTSIFEDIISKAIGIVAVMRLAIDPLPILVKDDEIFNRIFETLNRGFSDKFINQFIGQELIDQYKKTDIYINHYDSIMLQEKRFPETTDVVQHQYVDTTKTDRILSQSHLINQKDIPIIKLFATNNKFCKAYSYDGLRMFFSDKKTVRSKLAFDSRTFQQFKKSSAKYNQPYDEAFISVFTVGDEFYYMEHNEALTKQEISKLLELL